MVSIVHRELHGQGWFGIWPNGCNENADGRRARQIPLLLFHARDNLPAVNKDDLPNREKQAREIHGQDMMLGRVTSQVRQALSFTTIHCR